MKYLGVIDKRMNEWSLRQRHHLIDCLSRWQANLYIYGGLTWGSSKDPLSSDYLKTFCEISAASKDQGLELWAWMKPGDHRYLEHSSDRRKFIENAVRHLELGAEGFYLLMDDMHPKKTNAEYDRVHPEEAKYQARLIEELAVSLGTAFKGICGEQYHGRIPEDCPEYWEPILSVLPTSACITWTGAKVWNRKLDPEGIPQTGHPCLLWDNYFASDSTDPARSPLKPYNGRSPKLTEHLHGVIIHPDAHYPWQYCNIRTAIDFWNNPRTYKPEDSFRSAIQELGDAYLNI